GGMSTLLQDGVRKVLNGSTTIPELLRVVAAV
ncbi:MAG: type II secretory ATPase GspE/PulE/Tfp pilus assembly ATPase PilB-like protein, partial [Planctomycetota bacterium]